MYKFLLTIGALVCVTVILHGQSIDALLQATDPTPYSQKIRPDTVVVTAPAETLVYWYNDTTLIPVKYGVPEYIEKVPEWTLEKILLLIFVSIVGVLLIVRLVQDIKHRWQIKE